MRRIALLGLCLFASGCGRYASNPFDGFGGFVADTHTLNSDPNQPLGDSDTMRRVRGMSANSEPLLPEPGNVWPGPVEASPTLGDLEKMNPDQMLKPGAEMTFPRTSPGLSVAPSSMAPSPTPPSQPAPPIRTLNTPTGPATVSGGGGVQSYTDQKGGTGLVVPNGNGTSTLIAPDGSVQTVPSAR
jgi:hypothetical protein